MCKKVACFVGEANEQESRIPTSLQGSEQMSDIWKPPCACFIVLPRFKWKLGFCPPRWVLRLLDYCIAASCFLLLAAQADQKAFKSRENGNSHKPGTLETLEALLIMAEMTKDVSFHIRHWSSGCSLGNSWSQAPRLQSAWTESYLPNQYLKRIFFGAHIQDTECPRYTTHV